MFHVRRNDKIVQLEQIIDEYQDRLFGFAFYRVGSFEVAQDIVQDLFLKFFNENSRLDRVANLKSYLYRAISNRCADYRRTIHPTLPLDAVMLMETEDEKSEFYHHFVSLEVLLGELPDEQAEVVRLHFADDLSFIEIAALLELSVNTVKSRFRYGIEKLKKSPTFNDFNYYE